MLLFLGQGQKNLQCEEIAPGLDIHTAAVFLGCVADAFQAEAMIMLVLLAGSWQTVHQLRG